MKNLFFTVLCAACCLMLAPGVAFSEPEQDDFASLPSTLVAPVVIESRMTEVEASSSQDEQAKTRLLEDKIARKRQEEADQALADAELARIQAEGKHPLVVQLAEQNAVLSEEIAAMASPMKALTEQTDQVKDLARQIEEDYNSARESIEIGGLSQELGHMLLQRSQSLPDPRLIHRQVVEREKKAAEIGVRRLRHRKNAKPLRNLNDYVDRIAVEAEGRDTPLLRAQLRDLGSNRKALFEQAIESDDVYLSVPNIHADFGR